MFDLENIVRENIKRLTPYSSARKEFSGTGKVFLDANENSFGSALEKNYHRYPDPLQMRIKRRLAEWNAVEADQIFIGNGSDEAIDLLFRIFCRPQRDNILIMPPTYGMYEVSAEINDAAVIKVNLTNEFAIDFERVKTAIDENTKLLFVCSPNNPTGNVFEREKVLQLIENFHGVIVVDEAYVHFSSQKSFVSEINNFPNLVVLQTFSKAWGLAGLRVGAAFGSAEIISLFNRVKPPYNVSEIAQEAVLAALEKKAEVEAIVSEIICERAGLIEKLNNLPFVVKIYPTDANFVLVKTSDADSIYRYLLENGIVVRNRSSVELCAGCLRITVGTPAENEILINALKNFAPHGKDQFAAI